MARKVNVTANRVYLIAFGNRLTLPFGLHLSASPCSCPWVTLANVSRETMLEGSRLLATLVGCVAGRVGPGGVGSGCGASKE